MNRGPAVASSISVKFDLVPSDTTRAAQTIKTMSAGSLPSNGTTSVVTTIGVPSTTLSGTYSVVASVSSLTADTSLSNNLANATLRVATATPAPSPSSCDYYASPNGSGNGLTLTSPFRIQNFWPVATPGKTLCLLDGTYQGTANMISPTPGKSGISGSPITVRALNDGAALIDGQFQLRPVTLIRNNWMVFEGFNARHGTNAIIYVGRSYAPGDDRTGSNNNIFRRIVYWDARIAGSAGSLTTDGNSGGNLFEDIGGFGTGGRVFEIGFCAPVGTPRNIGRRVWARYEGSIDQVYQQAITLNYGNCQGATCENCLATVTNESMPQNYFLTAGTRMQHPNNPGGYFWDAARPATNCAAHGTGYYPGLCPLPVTNYGLLFLDQGGILNLGDGFYADAARAFGSLAYVTKVWGGASAYTPTNLPPGAVNISDQNIQMGHVFSFIGPNRPPSGNDPGFSQNRGIRGFFKRNAAAAGVISRITSVTAVPDTIAGGGITLSDHQTATSFAGLTAAQNPWTGTSGAQLCYRWINERLTTTPLWPWPMNERIRAATASAGNYFANGGPGCGVGEGECTGVLGHTRQATDVMAEIQAVLGPIPAACRSF
jgi:hypothetical protein